jgi:hypothetical protein
VTTTTSSDRVNHAVMRQPCGATVGANVQAFPADGANTAPAHAGRASHEMPISRYDAYVQAKQGIDFGARQPIITLSALVPRSGATVVVAVLGANEAQIVDLDGLRLLDRPAILRCADFLDAHSVDESNDDVPAQRVIGDDFGT